MGVLPLQFQEGHGWSSMGLTGRETFNITGLDNHVLPGQELTVTATREDGTQFDFPVIARLDSTVDIDYYRNGGILQTVLRQMLADATASSESALPVE
ncbi:Aconitate hydratase [compost metagenome]